MPPSAIRNAIVDQAQGWSRSKFPRGITATLIIAGMVGLDPPLVPPGSPEDGKIAEACFRYDGYDPVAHDVVFSFDS